MLKKFFHKFRNDNKGSVMVEAAIIMPFLVMTLLGAFESTRYVMLQMKLERASVTLADLVARSSTLTAAQMTDIFAATGNMVEPFDMQTDGRVIISSVTKAANNPARVTWQRAGGGNFNATSRIGAQNANATLPNGFTLRDGESVIITEVFYDFDPFFLGREEGPQASTLYTRAFYRPRVADNTMLN